MKKRCLIILSMAVFLLSGCSKDADSQPVKQAADKEVDLTVWHYYNGMQKAAFDELVTEFNDTVGKEKGIFIESHSKGDVNELENAVLRSSREEVGSEAMPNIFSCYPDTAFEIEKAGLLADLSVYLTKEEQKQYVDSYIEEGKIGKDGELRIFPIAKSTEILMINKTAWDEFAAATGASKDELKTLEGMARVSKQYYDWTDQKTPDVLNDGKAFYGRDAMANLPIITSMQMGKELFSVKDKKVEINVDKAVFRNVWDNFYIPFVKGYYGSYGRFRSDDVKIGELVAYTGSIASASYFPDQVEIGDAITPIECEVMPAPGVEGGEAYIIQQGAGMVVTKKSEAEEAAAVEFLKWFTESERNIEFGCSSGYVPVKKEANHKEMLDKVIKDNNLVIPDKEYQTILTAFDMVNSSKLYTNKAFEGGTKARKVVGNDIQAKMEADRKQVETYLGEGMTLEEATESFISDEAFEAWCVDLKTDLEACVKGAE